MSGATTKWVVPYPTSSDTVAGSPTTIQNLAARVDLLLGESGVWVPTLVAATPTTVGITLGRTYPGNATTQPSGVVIIENANTVGAGVILSSWVVGWTGTATTITGFTLGACCSAAGARTFVWRFLPVL